MRKRRQFGRLFIYITETNSYLAVTFSLYERRKKSSNRRTFHTLPRQRQMDLHFTAFRNSMAVPFIITSHRLSVLQTSISPKENASVSESAKPQQVQCPRRHSAQRNPDGNPRWKMSGEKIQTGQGEQAHKSIMEFLCLLLL